MHPIQQPMYGAPYGQPMGMGMGMGIQQQPMYGAPPQGQMQPQLMNPVCYDQCLFCCFSDLFTRYTVDIASIQCLTHSTV